jgi:selenide,water dikinase
MDDQRLTHFSKGSGCGCKIAPDILQQMLSGLQPQTHKKLLIGPETRDDAAVYKLNETQGLIATTDFFTPIVDDPYDFGRIAATNAISDVYAMGGRPIMALSILGWPVDKLPASAAAEVIKGAQEVCESAGFPLAGGHSIDSPEPIFGLAVNGLVALDHIKTNAAARAGDLLYLTKPLGVGILATALKKGQLQNNDYYKLIALTTELNRIGEHAGAWPFVHAMTDVTGFGLLGHLLELAEGSGLGAKLTLAQIPTLTGLQHYLDLFLIPDNVYRNWNAYSKEVQGVTGQEFMYLCDPQTSGGLLMSVDAAARTTFERKMTELKQEYWHIGHMEAGISGCVIV